MSQCRTLTLSVLVLALCWIGSATVEGQLVFDFDCRRFGVDCGQGECDVSTGLCDCSKLLGFEPNYRCQNKTEFPCTESTYGTGCTLERVQVDCSGDEMFVNINPEGTFQGKIYVFGKDTSPCQLQNAANKPDYVKNKDDLLGLSLALTYTSVDCGDAAKTVNGTTTYARDYFIQYNQNFRSDIDQRVSVKCILTEGGTQVASQIDDVKETDGTFKDVNVDADADNDVITFDLKNGADQSLQSDVNLGDEIKLVFTLTPGRGYVDFSLNECKANNTIEDAPNSDFRSITFVENNCPSVDGQALFQNGIQKSPDSSVITVSISAFMFSGTVSKVGFACDIKLCREENKDDCQKNPCTGITSEADKEAEQAQQATTPISANASNSSSNATAPETGNANATTPETGNSNVTSSGTDSNNATAPDGGSNNATAPEVGNDDTNNNATAQSNVTTPAANEGNNAEAPQVARRRRRASGDEAVPVKRVYSDMTVRDPSAVVEEQVSSPVEKDCMREPEIVTVVAILSVMVLTLTLVTMIVICHVIRRGGHKKKNIDDDYSGSVGSSIGGSNRGSELRTRPEHVAGFNIPRLEIRGQRPIQYTTT